MAVNTVDEAKERITQWLNENGHQIRQVDDNYANFHFEIDYPMGTMKRQRVIQPKDYPGLILLLSGVAIAEDHKERLSKMSEEERVEFYDSIRKDLLFLDNSFDMNTDQNGIIQQIQFSYEFYFDSLTKTQLYRGLLLNHRTLLYIVTIFNEKFGIPNMPEMKTPPTATTQ